MKIKSIAWNGHNTTVQNQMNLETAIVYTCKRSVVCKGDRTGIYNTSQCSEIVEESPTIYLLKFSDGNALRIFNPIEVEFEKE